MVSFCRGLHSLEHLLVVSVYAHDLHLLKLSLTHIKIKIRQIKISYLCNVFIQVQS